MADLQQQYLVVITDIKHANGSVIRGVGRVVQDGLTKEEAKTHAQEHSGQILKQDKVQCLCVTAETTTDGLLLGEAYDELSKKTIKQSGITYDAASAQATDLSQPNAILVALPLSGTTKALVACLIAFVLIALIAGGVTLVSSAEEEVEPTTVAVEEAEKEETIVESEDDDIDAEEDLAADDSTDEEAIEDTADEAGEEATSFSSASSDSNSSGSSSSSSGSSTSGNTSSHSHNWVAQTTTVHHDAVYETVYHDAEYKSVVICNGCGGQYNTASEWASHSKEQLLQDLNTACGSYYATRVVTQQAWSEQVLVSAAYDETVTTGYKCSGCGATK